MKKNQHNNTHGSSSNGSTMVYSQNYNNSFHNSTNNSTNTQQSQTFYSQALAKNSSSNGAYNKTRQSYPDNNNYNASYGNNNNLNIERKNSFSSAYSNNSKPKLSNNLTSLKRDSISSDNGLNEQLKNVNINEAKEEKAEILDDKKQALDNSNETSSITDNDKSLTLTSSTSTASFTSTTSQAPVSTENSQPKLSDLVKPEAQYKDRSDYFQNLIMAVDQLYPESKWPLHSTWTFWLIKHDNNRPWSENLKTLIDVSYVEDFWSAANYLLSIPNLTHQGDLTFFKKGIKPEWEDDENKNGGCWLHQIGLQQQYKKLDELWQDTLLAMIGDNFCDRETINRVDPNYNMNNVKDDHICDLISGAILMHRKTDKISLWTKNYRDDQTTRLIG